MVPSSVTKVKAAPAVLPSAWKVKPAAPVKTTPVGVPATPLTGDGILTTSPCFTPCPLSSVETPALLSATHQGLVGPAKKAPGVHKLGIRLAAGWVLSESLDV